MSTFRYLRKRIPFCKKAPPGSSPDPFVADLWPLSTDQRRRKTNAPNRSRSRHSRGCSTILRPGGRDRAVRATHLVIVSELPLNALANDCARRVRWQHHAAVARWPEELRQLRGPRNLPATEPERHSRVRRRGQRDWRLWECFEERHHVLPRCKQQRPAG